IPLEPTEWPRFADSGSSPHAQTERGELLGEISRAIDTELTPHQREVLVALALNEVPIDVLAERLGTTRGALCKTLHDARRKLRRALDPAGERAQPAAESTAVNTAAHQAFWLLRIGFTVAPILFGLDKIFNWSVNWPDYLASWINNIVPGSAQDFMYFVGGVEILAGILVLLAPR